MSPPNPAEEAWGLSPAPLPHTPGRTTSRRFREAAQHPAAPGRTQGALPRRAGWPRQGPCRPCPSCVPRPASSRAPTVLPVQHHGPAATPAQHEPRTRRERGSVCAAARLRCSWRPRTGFAPRERRTGAGGRAPGAQPRGHGAREGGGASAGPVPPEPREQPLPGTGRRRSHAPVPPRSPRSPQPSEACVSQAPQIPLLIKSIHYAQI